MLLQAHGATQWTKTETPQTTGRTKIHREQREQARDRVQETQEQQYNVKGLDNQHAVESTKAVTAV